MKIIFFSSKLSFISNFTTSTPVINIGRSVRSQVHVEDRLASKVQCTVKFSMKDGWTLIDGQDESSSTNGTWFYCEEKKGMKLYDGLVWKSCGSTFAVKIINSILNFVQRDNLTRFEVNKPIVILLGLVEAGAVSFALEINFCDFSWLVNSFSVEKALSRKIRVGWWILPMLLNSVVEKMYQITKNLNLKKVII